MSENPGGAEAQHQQRHKQNHHQTDGESAPEQNATFKPFDLTGFGGLDLGDLGNVGAVGISQTAAQVIALCLEICHVYVGGGKVQIRSGQLVADFRRRRRTAVLTEGQPFFLGHKIEQRIVDGGDGEPLIIAGSGAKILLRSGLADGVLYQSVDILDQETVFLFDGFVVVPLLRSAEQCDVNTPAGGDKVRAGKAFGIKRGGIRR